MVMFPIPCCTPVHTYQTWSLLPLLRLICTYAQLVLVKHSLQSCIGAAFAARASMPVFSLAAVPCRAISLEV